MRWLQVWRSYRRDRRGDMYVDFLVKFFIAIAVVVTLTSFFNMFIKHQNVVFVAKRLVRAVEISGQNDAAIAAMFAKLCSELGLTGATFDLVDVAYLPGGDGKIQLRDTFTVVVRYPIEFKVAQVSSTPYVIPFTIVARLPGMSEVFWR